MPKYKSCCSDGTINISIFLFSPPYSISRLIDPTIFCVVPSAVLTLHAKFLNGMASSIISPASLPPRQFMAAPESSNPYTVRFNKLVRINGRGSLSILNQKSFLLLELRDLKGSVCEKICYFVSYLENLSYPVVIAVLVSVACFLTVPTHQSNCLYITLTVLISGFGLLVRFR